MMRYAYRTALVVVTAAGVIALALFILHSAAARALLEESRSRARAVAGVGTLLLAGDDIDQLHDPSRAGSFEHKRLVSRLRRIGEVGIDVRRVYLLRHGDAGTQLAIIVDEPLGAGEHHHGTGGVSQRADAMGRPFDPASFPELAAGFETVVADADTREFEGAPVLNGYAPVYNSRGQVSAVLGVTMDATGLATARAGLLRTCLFAGAIALLLVAAGGILYHVREASQRRGAELLRESKQDLTRMVLAEKELTRKNRELQALIAVSERLSESFELSRSLHRSLDCLLEVAGIDGAIIRLIDVETKELYLAAHRGLSPLLFEGYQRIPLGQSFSGSVAASGEALFVENIPATFGSPHSAPFDRRIRSYAIAPLKVQDRTLGTLTLFSLSDPKFPWPYRSMIFSVAQQVGVAVENANLFEKERNRSAQLALVADISRRSIVTMNVDELLQMAIGRIQKEFRYFFIAYYEADVERGECIRKAESGGFFEMGYGDLNLRQSLHEGMIAVAVREKRTVYVHDTSAEERFFGIPGNLAKSELVVPLLIEGEVAGLFDLQSTMVNGFTKEDILMMETLADQASHAIRNRRLYAQLQQEQVALETRPEADPMSAPVATPAPADEERPRVEPAAEAGAPTRGASILVIDDEDYVVTLMTELFAGGSNIVTPARTGPEGLSLFAGNAFDIVFTDLGLPGMSGLDVAESMKKLKPEIPIVLLTGYGSALDDAEVKKRGIDRIVPKPFTVQQILDCLPLALSS